MTTYHIKNTGSNTGPYDTWAKAAKEISTPTLSAGNIYYLSSAHVQNNAAALTLMSNSNDVSVAKLISGIEDSPSGLLSSSQGATINVGYNSTSNIDLTIWVSALFYGIVFNVGYSTSRNNIILGHPTSFPDWPITQTYENCLFNFIGNSDASRIKLGSTYANAYTPKIYINNCSIKFSSIYQGIWCSAGSFYINNLSIEAGSSAITTLITQFGVVSANNINIVFYGCDFSSLSASLSILGTQTGSGTIKLINCKMPSGWTGTLYSTINSGVRISLYNCDDGNTNYKTIIADYRGKLVTETVYVRDTGASDGVTPISWKIIDSNIAFPHAFDTDPIILWNDYAGISKTITIHVLVDAVTNLTNNELWAEISYLGTSGETLGSVISTRETDPVSSGTDLLASDAIWTTTGMTYPNPQKITATITPQQKGPIYITLHSCKPGAGTIYVCPKVEIT